MIEAWRRIASLIGLAACSGADPEPFCPDGTVIAAGETYGSLFDATTRTGGGLVTVCAGTFPGRDSIYAESDMRVEGAGVGVTVFDGEEDGYDGNSILTGDSLVPLALSGMTLRGGFAVYNVDESIGGGFGGGVSTGASELAVTNVEIRDNVATWSAGLAVAAAPADGSRPAITITDSRIVSNTAYRDGGAFTLQGPGTVTLVNVDLGTPGVDDNTPNDIAFFDGLPTEEGWLDYEPVAVYSFDGVVSVTCVWETRTCE
ncbi:MAG: hypothetical protein V4850_20555 [Myxococcota bacterium]